MICVYDIGNTDYAGNGNAVLRPLTAKVKMVAGGNWELSLTHPIDPEGKWTHLVPGAVIRVPVPEEEIVNAYSGYEAYVYTTNAETRLRESPSDPTTISYGAFDATQHYVVGTNVTYLSKNYKCLQAQRTYTVGGTLRYDPPYMPTPDNYPDWWEPIPNQTAGAATLATLPGGTDLYYVETVDSTWYKMSTYYGLEGYVKISEVTYSRYLSPTETLPRIITTQLTRITSSAADTKNGAVSVTAQHISYDLNGIIVKDVSISQAAPAMAIGRIVEGFMMNYPGTIATNLDAATNGTYTETIKGKTGMYCLMDPDKGIVSQFDAEFRRDNWDLFVMQKTDTDRGYRIKRRKNLLGVSWSRKSDQLVTRVVPVAKNTDGSDLYLPEVWIDSPLISSYPVIRMERLTVQGQVGKNKDESDDKWTLSDLQDEMRTKAGERFSVDKADQVVQDITIDFEMLGDTAEYAPLHGLERVLLYDKVSVEDETIGLSQKLTVTEMEWDAIRQRVVSVKISNTVQKGKGSVTGYNVQNKSIGSGKLSDDVSGEILRQAEDMLLEAVSDPDGARPWSTLAPNTKDSDGIVTKGDGQAGKVWKTDSSGNPAWRDDSTVSVVDNLTSQSATSALSANQGRVLNGKMANMPVWKTDTIPTTGKTFDITNGTRAIFDFISSAQARCGSIYFYCTNNGDTYSTKFGCADISITASSNNKLTLESAGTAAGAFIRVYAGSITEEAST